MSDFQKKFLYKLLYEAVGLTENELKCIEFNGEGFLVDEGSIFHLRNFRDVSDIKLMISEEDIHIAGEKKLDGSPDWRYKNHYWKKSIKKIYYFYFNGIINSYHKISVYNERLERFGCDAVQLFEKLNLFFKVIKDTQNKNTYLSIIGELQNYASLCNSPMIER